MASSLQALQIPLPTDGMAPDFVDDGLPSSKAAALTNVLLDRPGRIVTRGGLGTRQTLGSMQDWSRPIAGKGWEMSGRRLVSFEAPNVGAVKPWNAPYLRRANVADLSSGSAILLEPGSNTGLSLSDVSKCPGHRGVRVGSYVYGPAFDTTAAPTSAGSVGPNNAGTGADDATVGTVAWTNPGNALASDNVYATCVLASGVSPPTTKSHYLKATNFGFAVPAGAVIEGIEVKVECKSGSNFIYDNEVRIVKGGTIQTSVNRAYPSTTTWASSDTDRVYGSAADTWSTAWTPADINAVGFGVAISAAALLNRTDTASIDRIRITVYYSLGLPGAQKPRDLLQWNGTFAEAGIVKQTNCPKYGIDVASHYERLFLLGGDDPAAPGTPTLDFSMLYYSNPGGPITGVLSEWQTDGITNKIKVGDGSDDPGMALAHVGGDLMVLKRKSLWVLRGYSPSTFVLNQVSADFGCVDPRSVVEHEGNVYFMTERGYYKYDGSTLTNVSEGLNNTVLRPLVRLYKDGGDAPGDSAVQGGGYINCDLLPGGYILVSIGRHATGADANETGTQFLYHPLRGTWVYFSTAIATNYGGVPFSVQALNDSWLGVLIGTSGGVGIVTDFTSVTQPEITLRNFVDDGGLVFGGSLYNFECPMILRPWRAAGPMRRAWIQRFAIEHRLQYTTGKNSTGWVVTLFNSETTATQAHTLSASADASPRLRDTKDVLQELADLIIHIDRPAGAAVDFDYWAPEIRSIVVEWDPTRVAN